MAVPAPAAPSPAPPAGPAPMGPWRRGVRETGLALIALGVVVLLFVVYQLFGTNLTESRNQARLARQFAAASHLPAGAVHPAGTATPVTAAPASSTTTAPASGDTATVGSGADVGLPSVPPGNALDHLVIPAIGVDKYVVEGTNEEDLRRGPGHYIGTALPGQAGNTAIAGHRTTYGAPFYRLDEVHVGDPIYITDLAGRTWTYRVSEPPVVVSPDDVSVLDPTPYGRLTLTTCNPRFSATSRLVVFARLVGRALPVTVRTTTPAPTATPGTPAAAAAPALAGTDNLGQGSSGAWGPVAGYGAAAVALWIATRLWINRTRRWHRLGAYVVGIGVCLIPLWFCFENVVLLLPQSI